MILSLRWLILEHGLFLPILLGRGVEACLMVFSFVMDSHLVGRQRMNLGAPVRWNEIWCFFKKRSIWSVELRGQVQKTLSPPTLDLFFPPSCQSIWLCWYYSWLLAVQEWTNHDRLHSDSEYTQIEKAKVLEMNEIMETSFMHENKKVTFGCHYWCLTIDNLLPRTMLPDSLKSSLSISFPSFSR